MNNSQGHCFVCDKNEETGSYDGTYTDFNASPGYGSRFDMAGHLRIYVCDDCLEERKDRVTLVKTHRAEPEVDESPWACETCGHVAHEGQCHVEHVVDVLFKHGLEEGTNDGFIVGVKTEEVARDYVKSCEAHAREARLDKEIVFGTKQGENGRWVVWATKEEKTS